MSHKDKPYKSCEAHEGMSNMTKGKTWERNMSESISHLIQGCGQAPSWCLKSLGLCAFTVHFGKVDYIWDSEIKTRYLPRVWSQGNHMPGPRVWKFKANPSIPRSALLCRNKARLKAQWCVPVLTKCSQWHHSGYFRGFGGSRILFGSGSRWGDTSPRGTSFPYSCKGKVFWLPNAQTAAFVMNSAQIINNPSTHSLKLLHSTYPEPFIVVIPTQGTFCTPVTLSPEGHPQPTEHQQAERADSYQAVAAQLGSHYTHVTWARSLNTSGRWQLFWRGGFSCCFLAAMYDFRPSAWVMATFHRSFLET